MFFSTYGNDIYLLLLSSPSFPFFLQLLELHILYILRFTVRSKTVLGQLFINNMVLFSKNVLFCNQNVSTWYIYLWLPLLQFFIFFDAFEWQFKYLPDHNSLVYQIFLFSRQWKVIELFVSSSSVNAKVLLKY